MNDNIESVDVLIIGAGLSGIGMACHLRRKCAQQSFMILESRPASGGTWDLFRYPGIRSDSDMYTYGYNFKPWRDKYAIASGDKILNYIRETAKEYDVEPHIRYHHKVVSANWSSSEKRWHITAQRSDTNEQVTIACNFIFSCSGYYDYSEGYTPEFDGTNDFEGQIIHPQQWPEDLDYKDKHVVVVGSGATAVTLLPTMAKDTASIVMLQRSPTYIANVPQQDPWQKYTSKFLPGDLAARVLRWKKVFMQRYIYKLSRKNPKGLRRFLLNEVRKELGPDYDVATHFTPSYNPWDQRLCAVPDGDMFKAIRAGEAEVVTDHIASFNKSGISLKSGKQLNADIVVLATGLKLLFAGGINYSIDNKPVELSKQFVYRGMMLQDVPNLVFAVGYTNSSWTMGVDVTADYVCKLINKMQRSGNRSATPTLKGNVGEVPLLDFDAGYVLRAREQMPKSGDRMPWAVYMDYMKDFVYLRLSPKKYDEIKFDQ